ncbi:MAG: valine--tRNA ligase [Brevinema sp.]
MPRLSEYNPLDFEQTLGMDDVINHRYHSTVNPRKKPYTIVMPPPNITGMLHMGHILNNTIQDTLIRYKRMDGYEACWIPGLDHASIATETKVTQWLDSQNINKQEIGREKFLEYALQWKKRYGGIINDQLKRLGISCDWDRERFTMDTDYSKEVLQTFIDLFNVGLIYKGTRLVNWCPNSQSAISDDEVEYREVQGSLWHFAYPIKDSTEFVTIATTRPETMFGDTAVMVHPGDSRYKHLIGKMVILPFVQREIPIIVDDYVDPEFGTGIVKVTPAHDPNDYDIGQRHGLEMISIMTEEGYLKDNVPFPFAGLERFEARKLVVEEMNKLALLVAVHEHTHKVGYSQRGQVPIETMLSEQWFISMKELAVEAKKAVQNEEILFYPQHWTKTYFHWLDHIKDWCISRQLWWGHRIPVYTCSSCAYCVASLETVLECPQCSSQEMVQEESVLDTWASSWLWSYAVHRTEEDKNYYHPTDTLVTAPDIIFFWVARMIMAAKYFRKEIPFKNVYFTGLIRDELGRKMSKSLGNSPDPLDIMAEYGADALRFSIIRLAPLGNDILYSTEKVELGKRFANKLWNAARFVQIYVDQNNIDIVPQKDILSYHLDDFDKSILTRFNNTVEKVRDHFEKFRINDVAKEIYDFIWGDFCDKYVEHSKITLNHENSKIRLQKIKVLVMMFYRIIKLLHPIMPFITEKLYREIFHSQELLFRQYPQVDPQEFFEEENEQIKRLEQVLYMIREIRAESNVPTSAEPNVVISAVDSLQEIFKRNTPVLQKLARLSRVDVESSGRILKPGEATASEYDFQIFVNLADSIDKTKEINRLQKEKQRLLKVESSVTNKLNNPQFVEKAPSEVIAKEKAKLSEIQNELEKTENSLKMWDI